MDARTRYDISIAVVIGGGFMGYGIAESPPAGGLPAVIFENVCDSLYGEFKRHEYAPPPVLKRLVASGRLGRKSGRGFFEYEAGAHS